VPAVTELLTFAVVGITVGSIYGLAGTGLVLTYKTSGIFNFGHGAIAALMAFAFYDLRERQGLPWPVAMAICLAVLAPLTGLLLERMARRLADAPVALKIVATLGLLVGIQQLIVLRYGASIILPRPFLPTGSFHLLGVNVGADQLIVIAVALGGMAALTAYLRTRSGREMQAVVDAPNLLSMHGVSPVRVRRRAWIIGTTFAAVSGILLAPTVGLDSIVLTFLVVQAFGAAAIGMFTSIPLTYAGGLVVGVLASLSTKYVASVPSLAGIPPSVPFIVLFAVLVFAPARWLVDFTVERKTPVRDPRRYPLGVRIAGGISLVAVLLLLPDLVGSRLPVYTSAAAYVIVFLSLAVLVRTSGQVSLSQLAFAAVGAAASARLSVEAGLPWFVATLAGALVAVPVGALLAIPAIRRSGLYLALATFGFAVLLERLVFFSDLMFATSAGSLTAPRPSIAQSDRAYFYVVLAFAAAAAAFVLALRRSRLGRLLRAMADSSTALSTGGTSTTTIKVVVFCVGAFLAALGGALLGPVTGRATPADFGSLSGLLFIVLLVVVPGSEVAAAVAAAVVLKVLPSYSTNADVDSYQAVLFGALAVAVGMAHAGIRTPRWLARAAAGARRRPGRSPITARLDPVPERA
jgi:branched-subunit amino acid ABC-type transport system permease component